MSNEFLTADQERALKKGVNDRLDLLRKRGSNRRLDHLADSENPNRQVRKSDAEVAISGLHRKHDSGRAITKAAPASTNASAAVAALHSDRSLAGRTIEGPTLVAKLAGAVAQAVRKDYSSAREAKAEIRKLLSDDAPRRPRNHQILKRVRAKSGEAVLIEKRGTVDGYNWEILVDDCFHSAHPSRERAEKTFAKLTA